MGILLHCKAAREPDKGEDEKQSNSFQFLQNWKELDNFAVTLKWQNTMNKIEKAPQVSLEEMVKTMLEEKHPELVPIINKVNEEYEYWDTVKYQPLPKDCTPQQLWLYVKASRFKKWVDVWPTYHIRLGLTGQMQGMCHEFDMNFGDNRMTDDPLSATTKEYYLVSSLMEEAIASSQMEGANTTRRVAKEMLRQQIKPRDKSQQMIVNNYQTIQYIVQHQDRPLTTELLLHVHRLMTENTLNDVDAAGRFRSNDEVVVADGITHEVVHRPPSYKEIEPFVHNLCRFFNDEEGADFIHPLIRGIVIHFMVAYVHPFVDGNGRTARALFYWYLLKHGYRLTPYLSVSRVIARSKKAYEKAFLYTEADDNDIGYFVAYNMRVLKQAFGELQTYLQRKQKERLAANSYLQLGGMNERQAQIIQFFADHPNAVITIKELQNRFLVAPTTAKADIMGLIGRGLIDELSLNKVKKGYVRNENFEEYLKQMQD